MIGFEGLANRFSHLCERHVAFLLPAGTVVWGLEAVQAGMEVRRG